MEPVVVHRGGSVEILQNPPSVSRKRALRGVEFVTVLVAEGEEWDEKPRRFETIADANARLREVRRSAPGEGYVKCDVVVYFRDGQTYEMRADVEADGTDTDIEEHILHFLGYVIGERPETLSDNDIAEYEKFLKERFE
jgi:hypothetical protein